MIKESAIFSMALIVLLLQPVMSLGDQCKEGEYRCGPGVSIQGSSSTSQGLSSMCDQCNKNYYQNWGCAFANSWLFSIILGGCQIPEQCKVCETIGKDNMNPAQDDLTRWSMPCGTDFSNGRMDNKVWKWSGLNSRYCTFGCEPSTGACITSGMSKCSPKCNLGDMKCLPDNLSITQCLDTNGDGCGEWSGQIVKECCRQYDPSGYCIDKIGCSLGFCLDDERKCLESSSCCDIIGNSRICAGMGGMYSVPNMDYDNDGCLDYKSPGEYCTFGCIDGRCQDNRTGCMTQCAPGETRCRVDGSGQYVETCVEVPGNTGCGVWDDGWESCHPGKCVVGEGNIAACATLPVSEQLNTPMYTDEYTYALYDYDVKGNGTLFYSTILVDTSNNNHNMSCYGSCSGLYQYDTSFVKWGFNWNDDGTGYIKNGMYSIRTSNPGAWGMRAPYDYANWSSTQLNGTFETWAHVQGMVDGEVWYVFDYEVWNWTLYKVFSVDILRQNSKYYIRLQDSRELMTGNWHEIPFELVTARWFHIRATWGNGMKAWIDGVPMFNETVQTFVPPNINTVKNYYMLGGPSSETTMAHLDNTRISTIERTWDVSCVDECPIAGLNVCTGMGNGQYSVLCRYDPRTNCNVKVTTGSKTWCENGCDATTGGCLDDYSKTNECEWQDRKCFNDNDKQFEVYCDDVNGDSVFTWKEGSKTECPNGCDSRTGQCVPLRSWCSLGETRCIGSVTSPGENFMPQEGYVDLGSSGNSNIIKCGDMNGDGYLEWNINNITACQWGCQDDYSGATERHTASCNEAPNDLLRYQSAVNQVGATFSTAFEGPVLRFSISIVAFIIAFGLGMYFTRSVTFGFGAGTGVLGIAIAAGWVPTFLVVAIFAIAAYMVFKAWTGGELTG